MAVTYGFYNAINGDRRYDALQMSSIFDGIILDGVFQNVLNAFMVKPSEGMTVTVDPGRAWFNHTWTLNDSKIPIVVPQSEVILNRIDAIVLEVDARQAVRENSIFLVKGSPSSNPARPTLVKETDRWQYALAYIYVGAGVSEIRSTNITNVVGSGDTPFVTAPFKTLSLDEMYQKWEDAWDLYFSSKQFEMETEIANWQTEINQQIAKWELTYSTMADNWTSQWNAFYNSKTTEINTAVADWRKTLDDFYAGVQQDFADWTTEWESYYDSHTQELDENIARWKAMWDDWFVGYVNTNTSEMASWRTEVETTFNEWFATLQATLDTDVAGKLADDISALDVRVSYLEDCCRAFDFTAGTLTINEAIQDSTGADIRDSAGSILRSKMIYVRQ